MSVDEKMLFGGKEIHVYLRRFWGKQSTSVTTVGNVTEKVFCGNRHSCHAKHLAGGSMEKHKIDEI